MARSTDTDRAAPATAAASATPRPSGTAKRRAPVPAARRREQLLDVAADLILDQGPEAVTLQRVARVAEINHATIYRFFRNRDDLLLALLEREAVDFEESMKSAAGEGTFEDRLRELVSTFLEVSNEQSLVIEDRVQSLPARSDELREWQEARTALRVTYVMDVFSSHAPDISAQQALVLAAAVGTAVGALVRLRTMGMDRDLVLDTFVALVVGGLSETERRARANSAEG